MTVNREIQPGFRIPDHVKVHFPDKARTANGIDFYSINIDDTQDVVRLSLVFRAGTRFQTAPFQASATLNMLREGTKNYSASEISEKIDFYGAYLDLALDRDYSVVTVCVLSKFLPEILELLEDMIVNPLFPESELEIYKNKRRQALIIEREKISFIAREQMLKALFGEEHPYGISYPAECYDGIDKVGLEDFHKRFYNSANCFAVASGKLSGDDLSAIEAFLGNVPDGEKPDFAQLPETEQQADVYVEKEGAVQSAIRMGKLMFPRNHPDYTGMQVLSTVLGGYFSSRLIANLREDKGYTYGIFSSMVNLESTGYLAIATEVHADATNDAVSEIFAEMRRLREELVGEEELTVVKNIMTGEYLRILDGPFGIADVTIENIQNGNDNDYVNTSLQEIKAITPRRLKELAEKYLTEDGFSVVVVGKR